MYVSTEIYEQPTQVLEHYQYDRQDDTRKFIIDSRELTKGWSKRYSGLPIVRSYQNNMNSLLVLLYSIGKLDKFVTYATTKVPGFGDLERNFHKHMDNVDKLLKENISKSEGKKYKLLYKGVSKAMDKVKETLEKSVVTGRKEKPNVVRLPAKFMEHVAGSVDILYVTLNAQKFEDRTAEELSEKSYTRKDVLKDVNGITSVLQAKDIDKINKKFVVISRPVNTTDGKVDDFKMETPEIIKGKRKELQLVGFLIPYYEEEKEEDHYKESSGFISEDRTKLYYMDHDSKYEIKIDTLDGKEDLENLLSHASTLVYKVVKL